MLRYRRNHSDLLYLASYKVIEIHERNTGESPTGLFFNKVLSMLNRELESRHIHLGLPHCWYRWGDEVVRTHMPAAIEWIHEDPPRTTVKWKENPPEIPEGTATYDLVARKVGELVDTYSRPGAIEELVNHVYAYAPFPFQDAYRQVRNMFIDLRGAEIPVEGLAGSVLGPPFKRAMDVFPTQEFRDLSERLESFKTVMHVLIRADVQGLKLARELSEAFWFTFCYYLRLHPKAHQNVPDSTLDYWTASLPNQIAHYDNTVSSILLEAAVTVPQIVEDRSVSILKRDAERKRQEDLAFIHSFDAELNDIGKFLDATRRLRG